MDSKANVHWPEGKIIEGFPPDKQPTLKPGDDVATEFNEATGQYDMIGCMIDGIYHRLVGADESGGAIKAGVDARFTEQERFAIYSELELALKKNVHNADRAVGASSADFDSRLDALDSQDKDELLAKHQISADELMVIYVEGSEKRWWNRTK